MNSPSDGASPTPDARVSQSELPVAAIAESATSAEQATEAVELVACWRCHKFAPSTVSHCPFCEARLKEPELPAVQWAAIDAANPYASSAPLTPIVVATPEMELQRRTLAITRVLWFYFGLLGTSVLIGIVRSGMESASTGRGGNHDGAFTALLIAEGLISAIVIAALVKVPRPNRSPPAAGQLAIGWVVSLLLLGGVLAANVAYHWLLNNYLQVHNALHSEYRGIPLPCVIAAICVQPAIFEELFFRLLTLDTLRGITGVHAAVFVSSLMFGMAHLGVPLSIPILMVVGVGFGYGRVLTGGMIAPMLMHFAHNFAILYLNHAL